MDKIIKIKISTPSGKSSLLGQSPSLLGVWKNCEFHVDDDINDVDFWVVYENLSAKKKVRCRQDGTILITGEPPSVKTYNRHYVSQFNQIITCHQNIKHTNKIIDQQALPWRVGIRFDEKNIKSSHTHFKNYDYLKNNDSIKKSKVLSIIISNKKTTKGHKIRFDFAMRLKNFFKDKIDIYGAGINQVADKWDAIAPYKYHIAIENAPFPDYWTEKISDAFLGLSHPIYYGCPNIYDYFPRNSLTPIDINNSNAIKQIESVIEGNTYEQNTNDLIASKNLILDKYNLFPHLHNICNKIINAKQNPKKVNITLYPEYRGAKMITNSIVRRICKMI